MKNTLKWYDWIPIIGILTIRFRDNKFKDSEQQLFWMIYHVLIIFLLPLKEIKELL